MPEIQKISVALTTKQLKALKAAVDTGEYANTSEIVREALRAWQRQWELRGEELNRLRALWREGKASGSGVELNPAKTREEARKKLHKAAEKIA